MRADIVPGGTFPDYELPDHTERPPQAQRAAGRRPADPHARARPLLPEGAPAAPASSPRSTRKIAVAYTQIATIATDEHHTLQEFRASVGAQWPFLSDPERTVQKDLDIQEYTDPENDPMIPHTLVLKPGLVIHSIYNGYWFWGRPSVDDLWRDLRAVDAARSARTGTSARRGCARPGTRATSRPSTAGIARRAGQPPASSPERRILMTPHRTGTREEWLAARTELLATRRS